MTVREFIDMCTQDWIDIDLFNCDTSESTTMYIGDVDDEKYEELMSAEFMSWDISDGGSICINYVISD